MSSKKFVKPKNKNIFLDTISLDTFRVGVLKSAPLLRTARNKEVGPSPPWYFIRENGGSQDVYFA